jgi:hypothetical protein
MTHGARAAFDWQRAAIVVGAGLLLIGLAVLLAPVHVGSGGTAVSCGNALSPSDDASYRDAGGRVADAISGIRTTNPDRFADACAGEISLRRVIGWPLAIFGGLTLVGVAVGRRG